jgi:transcriptional regulator with XRE-family HTH domain
MHDANTFLDELLRDPAVKAEYDRQAPRFELYKEFLRARQRAKLDQKTVAARMGTTDSVIARMESASAKTMPSWRSIERFAAATGHRARVVFEPIDETIRDVDVTASKVRRKVPS